MTGESRVQTSHNFDRSMLPDVLSYLIFSKFDQCSDSVFSAERNDTLDQVLLLNNGALFRSLNEKAGGLVLDRITFAHSSSKHKNSFDKETHTVDSMDSETRQWLRYYYPEDDLMNPKSAGEIIGPINKFVVMIKIAKAEPWQEHNKNPAQ
jgi:hypothetical protein